jgi:hypothetical protein
MPSTFKRVLFLVATALVAAVVVHFAIRSLWVALGICVAVTVWVALRIHVRRRAKKLLTSGKPEEVLEAWYDALSTMPHSDTTIPLLRATALAATGMTDPARQALARAERGTGWDAAEEHRLILETMLNAFDGDRELALEKARTLAALPVPRVAPEVRGRIALLREAMSALARAFAHTSEARDLVVLHEAAERHALIHWPLRYAAAVVCIDHGDKPQARKLLEGAPAWPAESSFTSFHAELAQHAAEGASLGDPSRVD